MLIRPVKINLSYDAAIYRKTISDWCCDIDHENLNRFFQARFNKSYSSTVIDPEDMTEFMVNGTLINAKIMLRPQWHREMPTFKLLGVDTPEVRLKQTNKLDGLEYDVEVDLSFYVDDADLIYLRLLAE